MLQSFFFKKQADSQSLFATEFSPQGVSIAEIEQEPEASRLTHCAFLESPQKQQVQLLREHVQRHALQGRPCSVVLHPSQYQLLFLDRPEEIPDDELAEALRWRIKDLSQIPMAEAVLEVITLPADAFRGRMQMVYVVVAHRKTIEEKAEAIKYCGLHLQAIDIGEMALRNIGLLLPQRQQGFGIVRVEDEGGTINLMEKEALYLSRRIENGLLSLQPDQAEPREVDPNFAFFQTVDSPAEALLLELQRSLDYYESQLGKGSIARLHFTPLDADLPLEFLQERLGIPVEVMQLNHFLQASEPWPLKLQQRCIRAIGGALRQREQA
ncbi:putative MSHA biogenesis protein MshI [Desulfurispirillum indicum S5]|uniref:Putative MSHA biogenesis protein MshI n=1 Tax=Desulfurispirillum indicum (strain ATCC BAA-1389 / DSM 22839 / S5) TaxID=653733 RepID=E6W618_DESIS|nr:hypothetical protein [Desulfurispirillum indicum]ADU64957.1 putative MSHA biogenesis protein MshI [Desulfurispirillum indicum S5]